MEEGREGSGIASRYRKCKVSRFRDTGIDHDLMYRKNKQGEKVGVMVFILLTTTMR